MLKLMAGLLKGIALLIVIGGAALVVVQVLELTNVLNLTVLPVAPGTALLVWIVYIVSTLLATALSFLFFSAIAELMLVLVAIENNTRQRQF